MVDIANSSSSSISSEDEDIVTTTVRVLPKTRTFVPQIPEIHIKQITYYKLRSPSKYAKCMTNCK